MASPITIPYLHTRVNNADALGSVWQDLGGGATVLEIDFVYQGTNSISEKVKTSESGVKYYNSVTSHALSTNNRTVIFKVLATNKDVLNNRGATGGICEIGSGDRANYYRYYVLGADNWPKPGGWQVVAINPNVVAWRSATVGTPNLAAVDNYAWACTYTATSKSENTAMDAIDFFDDGGGFRLSNGDGASFPDGNFGNFSNIDEGQQSGSYGVCVTVEGIFYVLCTLTVGSTTIATEFTDIDQTIVYPNGFYDAGFVGMAWHLGNATSEYLVTRCNFLSRGFGQRILFDTELDIDGGAETIVGRGLTSSKTLVDEFPVGTAVIARSQGGTETPGITDGTRYWIGGIGSAKTLHTSQANALAGTSPVNLTASTAGNGEYWRLDTDVDTRAIVTCTGTLGTLDYVGGSIVNHESITMVSNVTLTDVVINLLESLTLAGGTLSGCLFNQHTTQAAEWMILATTLADISNCSFDNTFGQFDLPGRGHAININTAGTYTFTGNSFTGYATGGQTTHEFDNTADITQGTPDTITLPTGHGYVAGSPVVYSRTLTANTAVGGLTEGTTYFLGVPNGLNPNDFSIHLNEGDALNDNAAIALTTGTGNETHALWPASAAIYNSSGGLVTINVGGGGTVPTIRNNLDATTVVNNAVNVIVQGITRGSAVVLVSREAVGSVAIGDVLFQGFADQNGQILYEHNYVADLDINVRVRNAGIAVAAIADDGGVFVDETEEASDSTTNDMNILPAAPALNDAYYFGHTEQFSRLKLDITDANGTGSTITWEYWDGLAWSALTGVVDGTSNLETLGDSIVSWTVPGDWATTTVTNQANTGPLYYVRARLSVVGSANQTRARKCTIDATRYEAFPGSGNAVRTITSTGLTVTAVWVEDTIGQFEPPS